VLVELGRRAEATGWDGFFVWDHIAYRDPATPVADPWIVLAAVATTTERIRLGALVTPLARRRPWKVARETASLDRLSGGRLTFGAGLGATSTHEFEALGEETDLARRASLLDEGLELLAAFWSGEPFDHDGPNFTVRGAAFQPTPLQRPRIPVWIAGKWPAKPAFRRAARWDGVFPIHRDVQAPATMSPEQLGEIVGYTLAHRTATGPLDVALEASSEGADPAAALAATEPYREAGLTWWIERLHPARGPLAEMRARLEAGPPRES
jgi:alkanesulfonate monooxygenase SsuD/methylene tetrahydromethanopterin reductase-like flavin-dependent oxidoreductase (luciferase family)